MHVGKEVYHWIGGGTTILSQFMNDLEENIMRLEKSKLKENSAAVKSNVI